MKKELKMMIAKICTLAVIFTTVFPGSVPVMAEALPDEITLYENETDSDIADGSVVSYMDEELTEEDTVSVSEQTEPDTVLTEAEEIISESENIQNPLYPSEMSVNEEETPEQFLDRVTGAEGIEIAETVSQNVADEDFSIVRYPGRITISNNQPTVSSNNNDLYAVVVISSNAADVKECFWGIRIQPGKTISIYEAYDKNGNQSLIDTSTDYVVWLGRGFTWQDEKGVEHIEDFGIIGYTSEYDDNGNPIVDEGGNIKYFKYNILKEAVTQSKDIKPDSQSPWKDGYSEIKLKAAVQKNMSIKLSWAPNSKDELQKTFKKYVLFELTADSTSSTGYKETQCWPMKNDGTPGNPSGSRAATLKPGFIDTQKHIVNSSMIYLLKCYDKDGNVAAQYATTAAPYFLQMLSGGRTGEFEFRFTQNMDNSSMYYRLEVAEKNTEATLRVPGGFHDGWSVDYSGESLEEDFSIGNYMINAKNLPRAVSMTYSKEVPSVTMGRAYFGRVQTITHLGSLTVRSAPSNVLSAKAGPDRCIVLDMAGVYFDVKDAKSKINRNKANIGRASTHINSFLEGSDILSADGIYIHGSNKGVDLKSGMIFFIGEKDESNIKSYDLLRSVSENGPYKRIKNYPLTSNMLLKLNITVEGLKEENIYAMQYTSFPMEKDFYYTVRAVSKTGNAPGGYYNGEYNKTDMDCVQGFSTADADLTKIGLAWEHDDCVRQYWIYRSDTPFPDMSEAPVNDKGKPCPIAKVSGSSFKKIMYDVDDDGEKTEIRYHLYYDKKVKTDKTYYYFVRPVYNIKSATTDRKYNMDKCSPEVEGRASAANATVKTFSAANYATGTLRISFKPLKANNEDKQPIPTKYRIYRLDVDSSVKKLNSDMKPDILSKKGPEESDTDFEKRISGWTEDQWDSFFGEKTFSGRKWTKVNLINGDGKSTKTVAFNNDAEVGHYYFYLIQFATEKSASQLFTYTSRVRNVPLQVDNIKAEYSGSGSGIKISWNRNGRDNGKPNLITQISTDGGYSWKNIGSATQYTDDSLPRGNERTYKVRVAYTGSSPYVYSSEASITASLPSKIDLSDKEIQLHPYQNASFTAKAVRDGGANATLGSIEMGCGDNDIIEFKQEGNTGKIIAKKPGTVYITVRCAGISRDVKVIVRQW